MLMTNFEIGFIGFGLIGGSVARGLKQTPNLDLQKLIPQPIRITVFDYHVKKDGPAFLNQDLRCALSDDTIDAITGELSDLGSCNLIFLCAPVESNLDYLEQLTGIIRPDCLITDVGSVKGNIVSAAKRFGLASSFLGGHPMAGSEQTGYRSSNDHLLENAYYILTPQEETKPESIELMTAIIRQVGAIPVVLDPKEHDDITAAISHVPHLIAAALVNMVRTFDKDDQMKLLAAGGFKDITRIASSSPAMWRDICLSNTDSICDFLGFYRKSLENLELALQNRDAGELYKTFETSKEYRNSIPDTRKGPISSVYEVFVDMKDSPGAIARVATVLAEHEISIKNIGIIHNREFQDGVLRIELNSAEDIEQTRKLLPIHEIKLP